MPLEYTKYVINWTDPTDKANFDVDPGVVDTNTSINLYGAGAVSYGEGINENLIHLLEHFSSDTAPRRPTKGQLWYKSDTDALVIQDGSSSTDTDLIDAGEVASTSIATLRNNFVLSYSPSDSPYETAPIPTTYEEMRNRSATIGWEILSTGGGGPINTLVDLKALDVSVYTFVYLLGTTDAGDGGQGHFYYDIDSTDVADDLTIILPDSGTGRWISLNAVGSHIPDDDSVATDKIQNNAVTTDKIKNNAITEDKIQNNAISTDQLQNNAVTEDEIQNSAVTTNIIANGAVTTNKLADYDVISQKLATNAVTTNKITDAAVTTDKIADGAITVDKLASVPLYLPPYSRIGLVKRVTGTPEDSFTFLVEEGAVMNDDFTRLISLTFDLEKDVSATFATGYSNGCISDVDGIVNSSWYKVFLVTTEDGFTTDIVLATSKANALADTNVAAANLIYARYIDDIYVYYDGDVRHFAYNGNDEYYWSRIESFFDNDIPDGSLQTVALMAPAGKQAIFTARITGDQDEDDAYIKFVITDSNDPMHTQIDAGAAESHMHLHTGRHNDVYAQQTFSMKTSELHEIGYWMEKTQNNLDVDLRINTIGWKNSLEVLE